MQLPRVGYVVKRYPRYSETFIVNEILAHEAASLPLEIFSLYAPIDTHFQDAIARVRSPAYYLPAEGTKVANFWAALGRAAQSFPEFPKCLPEALDAEARDVFQAIALAQAVRERRLDHLHAHFASSATSVARLAAQFAGITYSFTAHAKDIFHADVRPDDLRKKMRDAASTITVSDFNAEHLRKEFGDAAAGVQRIYNGLHLDRFTFTSPEERPPVIMAVGRLVEKKGFGVLIDACALLAKRGVQFTCVIIGTGDLEQTLQAQIAGLGLVEKVQLAGPRPQHELIQFIQSASVLAAPCLIGEDGNRDGLPTVLLEAMALGTPCVSTDVTGIPEVVRPGETGLLVTQRDPDGLARALEQLLVDHSLRVRLAARARRLIESEFNIEANAACLRQQFIAACARRGSPHTETS